MWQLGITAAGFVDAVVAVVDVAVDAVVDVAVVDVAVSDLFLHGYV